MSKPTRIIESVYFNHTIRVQGFSGSIEVYDHLSSRMGEWHVEMSEVGIVRIWNERRRKSHLECQVYCVRPENLSSWSVRGDTVQTDEGIERSLKQISAQP